MKAQNQIKSWREPWAFLQSIAAAVAGAFNHEIKRNKLPGNVKVTASPDNDTVQMIPIFKGKVESRRAVQSCSVIARRMKGKAFGI